jgi:outer membrane protein assembly factor BamB
MNRSLKAALLLCIILLSSAVLIPFANADWTMFRHDPQHTGYSTSAAPNTNEIKWIYNTATEIDSSPAVANGRVIVGLSNGNVVALNSTTGERLWLYETGAGSNSIWSSPAIDSDRTYIGTRDHTYIA